MQVSSQDGLRAIVSGTHASEVSKWRERTLDLLRRWRAGDDAAGERLFRVIRVWLVAFFRRQFGDEVDDLVQQTLVGCLAARTGLRQDEAFFGYVRCIARRTLLNHRRRARPLLELNEDVMADQWPALGEFVEQDRCRQLVLVQRAVVIKMYYLDGRSAPEIARVLGISESGVWRRIRKEMSRLRVAMGA